MLPRLMQVGGQYGKQPQICERENISIIRKGLVAAKPLSAGHILKKDDLHFARPSSGYPSSAVPLVIGKRLSVDVDTGFKSSVHIHRKSFANNKRHSGRWITRRRTGKM